MPDDLDLDSIGLKHSTDKASFHHDHLTFYEQFFAPLLSDVSQSYSLRIMGRFGDVDAVVGALSGDDCVSPRGRVLCGLQVDVARS